jgi:hypothetical protein
LKTVAIINTLPFIPSLQGRGIVCGVTSLQKREVDEVFLTFQKEKCIWCYLLSRKKSGCGVTYFPERKVDVVLPTFQKEKWMWCYLLSRKKSG